MRRISCIRIVSGGDGGDELLRELYNNANKDIPVEWKKKYAYSGRGQLNLPLEENSESYKYVLSVAHEYSLNPSISLALHKN